MSPPDLPAHRRDATATRQAILGSALVAFTRSGYDGAGVRQIAQQAGVTAMLVNRYFGSKERLFAEVVEVAFADRALLTDDAATLAKDVASALARQPIPATGAADGFLLLLRSISNPRAAEILRDGIERHFERHLVSLIPDTGQGADGDGDGARKRAADGARERAALFLSVIAGVRLMREIVGTAALAEIDSSRLQTIFEFLLDPAG
jgi:AcrR family transcriptional regulator